MKALPRVKLGQDLVPASVGYAARLETLRRSFWKNSVVLRLRDMKERFLGELDRDVQT